jgi:pimeloyl-ACP methyl ester carboxylesterase
MPMTESECRHIVRHLRGVPLPADLAAFHVNTALVCASLCRLTYIAFREADFDPERDHIPIDGAFADGQGATVDVTELLRFGDFGERFSFAIDTYFVKIVGVRIDDAIFVAFRGTKGLKDWLINLHATTETMNLHAWEGRGQQKLDVHSGFMKLTGQIRRGVIREVAKIVEAIRSPSSGSVPQVVACGHSLGGALALLFSARFNEVDVEYDEPFFRRRSIVRSERNHLGLGNDGVRIDSIYSFGAPMVGKNLYAASLNVTHHRIVADMDLVPNLPSGAVGFEHDTDALVLSESGPRGAVVRQHGNAAKALRGTLFKRNPLGRAFANHSVDLYLRRLHAMASVA